MYKNNDKEKANLWLTILIIFWFEKKFGEFKAVWVLIHKKALSYVSSALKEKLDVWKSNFIPIVDEILKN